MYAQEFDSTNRDLAQAARFVQETRVSPPEGFTTLSGDDDFISTLVDTLEERACDVAAVEVIRWIAAYKETDPAFLLEYGGWIASWITSVRYGEITIQDAVEGMLDNIKDCGWYPNDIQGGDPMEWRRYVIGFYDLEPDDLDDETVQQKVADGFPEVADHEAIAQLTAVVAVFVSQLAGLRRDVLQMVYDRTTIKGL